MALFSPRKKRAKRLAFVRQSLLFCGDSMPPSDWPLADEPPWLALDAEPGFWPRAPWPGWQAALERGLSRALAQAAALRADRPFRLFWSLRSKEKLGFFDGSLRWRAEPAGEAAEAMAQRVLDAAAGLLESAREGVRSSILVALAFGADAERLAALAAEPGAERFDSAFSNALFSARLPAEKPIRFVEFASGAMCAVCARPGRPCSHGSFLLSVCPSCSGVVMRSLGHERGISPETLAERPPLARVSEFALSLIELDQIARARLIERLADFYPAPPEESFQDGIFRALRAVNLGHSVLTREPSLSAGPESLQSDARVSEAFERAVRLGALADPNEDLGGGALAVAYCSTRYSLLACERVGSDLALLDSQGASASERVIWRAGEGSLASLCSALAQAQALRKETGLAPRADAESSKNADARRL
jgi:hypothetical protein